MLPALSSISFLGSFGNCHQCSWLFNLCFDGCGLDFCPIFTTAWIVFCPSPLASWSRTSISKQLSFSRLSSETSWYPTVYSSSISCYSLLRRWHLCEQRKSQLYSKWQTYVIFSFKNAKYSFGPRYIDHNMFRRMFCYIFSKKLF